MHLDWRDVAKWFRRASSPPVGIDHPWIYRQYRRIELSGKPWWDVVPRLGIAWLIGLGPWAPRAIGWRILGYAGWGMLALLYGVGAGAAMAAGSGLVAGVVIHERLMGQARARANAAVEAQISSELEDATTPKASADEPSPDPRPRLRGL